MSNASGAPRHETAARLTALVARLGGHPAAALGIQLSAEDDPALWRWLVAACLLGDRLDEARVASVLRELDAAGLGDPGALAKADPRVVAAVLDAESHRHAERRAAQLVRAAAALVAGWHGSLARLGQGAEDLEALGAALVGLAPGLGAATVHRFLAPLRSHWSAAAELPLTPAVAAAAHHLGLAGEDEFDPSPLRRASDPSAADLEAALARLGARACLRGRAGRCPLGADCPLRENRA